MDLRRLAAGFCLLLALPAFTAFARAQAATPAASYADDPKFKAALGEAKSMFGHHQFGFAADAYKKANKLADGKCLDCLSGWFNAAMRDGDFKGAANAGSAMEELASTPAARSIAEYQHARAVYASAGGKPKTDKLEAAHGLLQKALGNSPKSAAALFLDGQILAELGKMDEAKTEFAACVQCVNPRDPGRLRAEHFAENPELALHKMAPTFEVTAMDGSKFNLDAMGGRVVLIDFWATWCGPCNREIPHMKAIAKEFAGDPLVMISVSLDKDEATWKEFIAKQGMTWVQYRDKDGKLGEEFEVTTIPRYFTIDSDGVLTSVMVDEGSDVEGKLKKLIAKAKAAQKETLATTASTGATAAAN